MLYHRRPDEQPGTGLCTGYRGAGELCSGCPQGERKDRRALTQRRRKGVIIGGLMDNRSIGLAVGIVLLAIVVLFIRGKVSRMKA